ncbi:Synaptobrevin YKT6 isoform 1 [Schistosoma japonicum]|uniref:Synaptobrevin YKT6 isoform 1 n=1 Tax=Schistosoma japonicum TaxID=6182 RepID=A0A4Z2CRI5_SCHJA|nr:Synaptobrevin YKT6 isoform 1 [Schistosoma japonicum]
MKLLALQILYKTDTSANLLQSAYDLKDIGYFQRPALMQLINFSSKLVCERTGRCQRALIREKIYVCHVYVRHDNLCGVLICDEEYPERVAQTLLTKATEDFSTQYPADTWINMADGSGSCKKIDEYLQKYQNPTEADGLMKLQSELDETKFILHNTLESLLSRGEKLDNLIERSEELSLQSKMFYATFMHYSPLLLIFSIPTQAKKTNKCCVIL